MCVCVCVWVSVALPPPVFSIKGQLQLHPRGPRIDLAQLSWEKEHPALGVWCACVCGATERVFHSIGTLAYW